MEASSIFHLGENIRLQVTEWKGQRRVDIRMYNGSNPTKTGISLTPSHFRMLVMNIGNLSDTFQEVLKQNQATLEVHLGGNTWAYTKSPYQCIQIRKKFMKEGVLLYSPYGISLKAPEWNKLCEVIPMVDACFPDIKECVPCSFQNDHSNQLGALYCRECNPNMYNLEDY